VPSSRVPAGEARRSGQAGAGGADVAADGEMPPAAGGRHAEKRPVTDPAEGESAESSVPVARMAGYQEEAAELLESASSGSTPARRRRKATGGVPAGETAEPPAKTTRSNRRGSSTRPPAKG
jgi:hypothetical protein